MIRVRNHLIDPYLRGGRHGARNESKGWSDNMKKVFMLFAVLVWVVLGFTALAKDKSKVNCCIPTKSGKVRCVETTKPECKNQHGRVVSKCEDCK